MLTPQLHELRDDADAVLARYELDDFIGTPRVLLREIAGAPHAVATTLSLRHPKHRVATVDPAVAEALLASGATLVRDARMLVRSLTDPLPPHPGQVTVAPVSDDAAELVEAYTGAYPPGHPDHIPSELDPVHAAATLAGYLRGEVVGPFMPEASLRAPATGPVGGAIIISLMPADSEYEGGPWVTELFVHPSRHGQGYGTALLTGAMHVLAAAGHVGLGLAVTVGNPAESLYRSLGFAERMRTWTLITGG